MLFGENNVVVFESGPDGCKVWQSSTVPCPSYPVMSTICLNESHFFYVGVLPVIMLRPLSVDRRVA
jgi:hypothetical protein